VEFAGTAYEVAGQLAEEWETRPGYTGLFFFTLTTTKSDLCWTEGPGQVKRPRLYDDPEAVLIELFPMVRAHIQRLAEKLRVHVIVDAAVGENLQGGQIHIHILVQANSNDLEKVKPDEVLRKMMIREEISRNLNGWAASRNKKEKLMLLAKRQTRLGWKWGKTFDFQVYRDGGGAAEYTFQSRHRRLLVAEQVCCRRGSNSCKRGICLHEIEKLRPARALTSRL